MSDTDRDLYHVTQDPETGRWQVRLKSTGKVTDGFPADRQADAISWAQTLNYYLPTQANEDAMDALYGRDL